MKKPWQVWLWYAISIACVIPAMVWLTLTTLALDRAREEDRQQTEIARRYAELQERINSALWRMDWMMIPLVAQEAARPHYMYQPFYTTVGTAEPSQQTAVATVLRPSPILVQPSEYISLHFEITPEQNFLSPQSPQGTNLELACATCNVPGELFDANQQLLTQIQDSCSYDVMSMVCPSEQLPDVQENPLAWQFSEQVASQVAGNKVNWSQKLFDNRVDDLLDGQAVEQLEFRSNAEGEQEPISQQQLKRNVSRYNEELQRRDKAAQSYAFGQLSQNAMLEPLASEPAPFVREGVMRAIWIDDKLILVRRVETGGQSRIQGCWLNWDRIRTSLVTEVADVLPELDLQPIGNDEPPDDSVPRLATLPVKLLVDIDKLMSQFALASQVTDSYKPISGLRLSIWVAWFGLTLGAIAIAGLLHGVMRLSERRGAFVSAVTHELRTPLTTFRMYAEMLAERMVPSPEKQQQYAATMKIEADRLGHLVENVLQYARLEKGPGQHRWELTTVRELIDRCQRRLEERVAQDHLSLRIDIDEQVAKTQVKTSPAAVELILFNLVENACKYAKPSTEPVVELTGDVTGSTLTFRIRDFGPGISEQQSRRLFRAFCKSDQDAADTAQGVGLGLSLCRRMAKDLGGSLRLDNAHSGAGAAFLFTLRTTTV